MKAEVIQAIEELIYLINELKLNGLQAQVAYLNSFREDLIKEGSLTASQKRTLYDLLFPPRGGLSDMNYWCDEFELRKKINNQISLSKTILADFLLDEK